MPVRFHLDENMPNAVAEGLRRRGLDVTTSRDAGLIAAPDGSQLGFARAQGRVLVTRDQDFLRFHGEGTEHAGIVFWAERTNVGRLIRSLDNLAADRSAADLQNRVVYL